MCACQGFHIHVCHVTSHRWGVNPRVNWDSPFPGQQFGWQLLCNQHGSWVQNSNQHNNWLQKKIKLKTPKTTMDC